MNSKPAWIKSSVFIFTLQSLRVRRVVAPLLAALLFMQVATLSGASFKIAASTALGKGTQPATTGGDSTATARSLRAIASIDTFSIVLTPVSTTFNDLTGIDHHQPANKVVVSVNQPAGQPRNFELLAADGAHSDFSNVAGLTGELKIATARDDGQGTSRGGFAPGELFVGAGAPGVIARIAADGSTIRNPWSRCRMRAACWADSMLTGQVSSLAI